MSAPTELMEVVQGFGNLNVAIAAVDLDVAIRVLHLKSCLELTCLALLLEVAQPGEASVGAQRLGRERNARRALELLARQSVNASAFSGEGIKVDILIALATCRLQERRQIVIEDGELRAGPVAPRSRRAFAHVTSSARDSGNSSHVRPSSSRPPLLAR